MPPAVTGSGRMTAMPLYKPHALAHPHADQLDLRMGDRVRAIVDLPDVAEGTEGKVILANGFNWQRYRVLFSNGTELARPRPAHHRADRARRQAPGEGRRQGLSSLVGLASFVLRSQMHRFGASGSGERRRGVASLTGSGE